MSQEHRNSEPDRDLAALESALQAQTRAQPSAEFEGRVLAALERAATRERWTNRIAIAACIAAFLGLQVWLSALDPARDTARSLVALRGRDAAVEEFAGIKTPLYARASIPRIAPPQGSGAWLGTARGL